MIQPNLLSERGSKPNHKIPVIRSQNGPVTEPTSLKYRFRPQSGHLSELVQGLMDVDYTNPGADPLGLNFGEFLEADTMRKKKKTHSRV